MQKWAAGCFELPPFPHCLPWGKAAVVCILPPQAAKTDVAVMLPENTALPKTSHPTDELAAQWKGIEPERDLSQLWISSAKDIISQAGIAGQVYLRIMSLPGISELPQDIHANKAI